MRSANNKRRTGLAAEVSSADEARAALAFIEAHLFDPLDVKRIAASCGASEFHFCRQFRARQGESVMAYVRGRRLEAAMQRLRDTPNVRLIDLSFECGFESQEAFTRAFTRAFGQSPGRFRNSADIRHPILRQRRRTIKPTIHESIQQRDAFALAGMSRHFTPATTVEMSELWQRFVPHIGFAGQLGGNETYGVWRRRNIADGGFDFFAAVRVAPGTAPPAPLEILEMHAQTYLVFRQMLTTGELHPQMQAATDVIWGERLPRSGYALADAPDFQVYPTNFKVEEGGWVEHYLPIQT